MQNGSENILTVIVISSLLMAILAGFIVIVFLQYEKKRATYYQSIEQLKLEHENNLLSAQLEIQENTLTSISQEIHDNIGLCLTLAKLNINSIHFQESKINQNLLNDSGNLISKAIQDLSQLSRSFNSDIVKNQGIVNSIEHELDRMKNSIKFKVECEIQGEPYYLNSQVEVIMFRIFQESMNNIIKHSEATHVKVDIDFSTPNFQLNIADNGRGFEVARVDEKKFNRAGIRNIRKRASLVGAIATIHSQINSGTRISINLPK